MRYVTDSYGVTADSFNQLYQDLVRSLLAAPVIHTGEWQAMTTSTSPAHATHELLFESIGADVPDTQPVWDDVIRPDQPWAEDHFQERVSGIPHNPPPSHVDWPHAVRGNGDHLAGKRFDHTYPERFWPKRVSTYGGGAIDQDWAVMQGIRFDYGDLADVVSLLVGRKYTRQAYLPVWFPEDTGATAGQRVPCTLGYHFLARDDRLHCAYYIRSCDIVRHFRNDVYFAGRLMQWICKEVNQRWEDICHSQAPGPIPRFISPGRLHMHISSLHLFVGDKHKVTS